MTIFDLLDRLAFLQGMPTVVIVLAAAFLAIVLWDYRIVVPAIGTALLMAGLLFVELLDPRLAVVYALAGLFVTLSLAVTAAQVNWGRPPDGLTPAEEALLDSGRRVRLGPLSIPTQTGLRLLLAAAALGLAVWLWRSSPELLPLIVPEQSHLRPAILGLMALGLVGAAAPGSPFQSGIGLLLFVLGFELYYSLLEQSIALVVALAAMNLLIAIIIAYLTQARHWPTAEEA